MRQIWIPRAGPPDVLELRDVDAPTPKAGEVRVRVEAAGVNFGDVMGRLGSYPDLALPAVPGFEVAGRVDAVGEGADPALEGRDVFALVGRGGYAEALCVPEISVMVRPSEMDAVDGAAFPVNFLTAYLLVERMGSLQADETMLVHSAGGGVGTAAIQLARRIGARVIGCASAHKHDFLKSLGVEHCIDYTAEDFEARVGELTAGRGVELVLDPRGGASFPKSCRCLAPTGRLGMYGMSSVGTSKARSWWGSLLSAWGRWVRFTPPGLINRSVGVFGVNLGNLNLEPERMRGWYEVLLERYARGEIQPAVSHRLPLERAADAHRLLEGRRNLGKVVLTVGRE